MQGSNNSLTWDAATPPQTAADHAEEMALIKTIQELVETEAKEDVLKQRKKELLAIVEAQFPQGEIGEWMRKFGNYQVSFRRGEKLEWDTDILKSLVDAGEVPDHIKLKLSVDKRKFDALPQHEKNTLLPALTIKPGTVKIEVESASTT